MQPTSNTELWSWAKIFLHISMKNKSSLLKRMETVIKVKGGHTKYQTFYMFHFLLNVCLLLFVPNTEKYITCLLSFKIKQMKGGLSILWTGERSILDQTLISKHPRK